MTLRPSPPLPTVRHSRRRNPLSPRLGMLFIALALLLAGCSGGGSGTIRPDDDTPSIGRVPTIPEPAGEPMRADSGAVSLVWENDFFAGEDANYTNGLTVGYLSPPLASLSPSNWLRMYARLFHFLPEYGVEGNDERIAFAIVHSMFTPADIRDPNPPLDDQPYAGIASFDQTFISRGDGIQHSYLLRLGWVGPRTGADELQRSVHEWIDSSEPRGWGTQLPDEGIINLAYECRQEVARAQIGESFSTDAVIGVGANAGTYFTGANVGITGRVGWNLPDPLGSTSPQRGLTTEAFRSGKDGRGWRLGFSAGVEGFAIAHYLPLDGNVFRKSRSVDDRAPFVASGRFGVDLGIGAFGMSVSFQKFTETFKAERSDNEYGTVTFSWSF